LLKPNKGFVVKTWSREAGRTDFDRERGKVFVNVCQHGDIAKPESHPVLSPDGRRGESWSLPNLCSPSTRHEQDKAGHSCVVLDIVFHPDVLARCDVAGLPGERWRQMVAKTAVEQCASHHELILDVPGLKLLKTKYYGEQVDDKGVAQGCCTMAWKPAGGFQAKAGTNPAVDKGGAGEQVPAGAPPPATPPAGAAEAQASIRVPKYTLVHRGTMAADLSSTWNDARLQGASPAPRPKELVVRIELPGVASAADVDLDITPRRLSLREEATGFELDLELPHAIDETHGSAKFDRSKQALTVVLPVVASDAAPAVFKPATEGQAAAEAAAEQADAEAAEAKNRAREAEVEAERRARERAAREERARVAAEAKEAARLAAVAQADKEAAARAQALARGAPPARATESAQRALQAASAPPNGGGEAPAAAGFESAAVFAGAREGKVFKAGAAGLGYYADVPAKLPTAPPQRDRLVVPAEVLPADMQAAGGADGEKSPEWVMVPKETNLKMDQQDEEVNGAPPAEPTGRGAMPALKNGLLFELD